MKKQFIGTYEDIVSVDNLLAAWQEFVRGKREKSDVAEFSLRLMDNIFALHDDLHNRAYRHGGYHAFTISDPKPRHIHKASVRDRLVHHAIYRVLYPFFERTFIADSFSCRIGKGPHKALNRFYAFAYRVSQNHTRTCWVLKCDIRKFFASVDHDVLLALLRTRIEDEDVLWLFREVICSFSVAENGVGLPLGNLTSQLFANVYLNELDQFVKHKLKATYYLRYADDFALLLEDKARLASLISPIRDFLNEKLKLQLHPDKVSIMTIASGVDFLGWVHFPDHRVLRTATKRRMMRRIVASPTESTPQSYLGLLRHGNSCKLRNAVYKAM